MISQIQMKEVVMYPDSRMDAKNASTYTGLAEKTLAIMRCEGKGPKYIKRGRIFYFKEDLDSWLQAGRVASTTQKTSLVG